MITLLKIAVAGAAGYAIARWLADPRRVHGARAPANGTIAHGAVSNATFADDTGFPREGGHPGLEPVEFGASDRPQG